MKATRSQRNRSIFKRKNLVLPTFQSTNDNLARSEPTTQAPGDVSVLVVNASQDMAKEITMELTMKLPGCSITYAPTIDLAKWILRRRPVDLVVSSSILPDGSVRRLQDSLERSPSQPALVVVSEMNSRGLEMFDSPTYRFSSVRRLGAPPPQKEEGLSTAIQTLGADIRNDLNNPLQEIVAMVFVAKNSPSSISSTEMALDAIDKAAANMASVVRDIEGKIHRAVDSKVRE